MTVACTAKRVRRQRRQDKKHRPHPLRVFKGGGVMFFKKAKNNKAGGK